MDSVDMDVDVNPDRFISEVEDNSPPGAEDRSDEDIMTEDPLDVDPDRFISEVEANFPPGAEDRWDKDIMTGDTFPSTLNTGEPHATWISMITWVVSQCSSLDQKYSNHSEARKLIDSHDFLIPILCECCKIRSCRKLRRLRILQQLQKPRPNEATFDGHVVSVASSAEATEVSWSSAFVGSAPEALWQHVCGVHRHNTVYAPFTAIIQSSGMGKSRLVDELAKNQFVIPICFRSQNQPMAFPPGDPDVYKFFVELAELTQDDVLIRIHVFLTELFRKTISVVRSLTVPPAEYARSFRDYMTKGQTMACHGENRLRFYRSVVRNSEELLLKAQREGGIKVDDTQGAHARSPKYKCGDSTAEDMAKQLICVLEGGDLEPPESPTPATWAKREGATPKTKGIEAPKFFLSFDEAHELTKTRGSAVWSTFSQLKRALRAVNRAGKPMFTLFLSTTGSIAQFNPSPEYDASLRVTTRLLHGPAPFTDLGFDQCVESIQEGTTTLEEVSQDQYMVKFGRPMFATRYKFGDATVRDDIVGFANEKLLGKGTGTPELSLAQKLACLSRRFPIDLLTTHYHSKEAREIREQVEHHMRVVLKIEDEFRSMKAVCSSEPLLAEAACVSMRDPKFGPASSLMAIFSGFAVDHGDRGELVGLLLLTMARDRSLAGPTTTRVISVPTFLQNLFRPKPQNIVDVLPSRFKTPHDQSIPLRDKFANAKLHFNHFIKVHTLNMLERRFVWRHACRGAAILCANSQKGVDAYIPFTFQASEDEQGKFTSKLEAKNMGLILCQFKNDDHYSGKPQELLFTHMDPFGLHIFQGDEDSNIPLIRIVFAMAGRTPSLQSPVASDQSRFTSYDIWCSGLSSKFYQVIDENDVLSQSPNSQSVWLALLDASHGWQAMYKPDPHGLKHVQNPGAADGKEFFKNWAPLE